jgi:membrane associated rhomboid family serine protease
LIVSIAGALGFNKMKLRWTFRRWGKQWRGFLRRGEQTVGHIRYQHKTCGECGAVQDRDAKVCTSCGEPLSSRRWQVFERLGLHSPRLISLSGLLGVMFAVCYVRLIQANGGGGWLAMGGRALEDHGAYLQFMVDGGDWWRVVTAMFLHSGLWHIGFNLFSLAFIGPQVSRQFGGLAMVVLFLVTGVAGNFLGGAMGTGAVGASGGIMGLVGVAAAAGHREGTSIGRTIRNDMLKWAVYVMLFGFFIGANNWAHAGGFVAGGGFGLAVDPRWLKRRALRPVVAIVGIAGVLGCFAATWAVIDPPASRFEAKLIARFEADIRRDAAPLMQHCDDRSDTERKNEACEELETMRRQCVHGLDAFVRADAPIDERAWYQARCNVFGPPRNAATAAGR